MVNTSEGITAPAFVRRSDERTVLATRSVVVTADAQTPAPSKSSNGRHQQASPGSNQGIGPDAGGVANGATGGASGSQISLTPGARRALEASAQVAVSGSQQQDQAGQSDPTASIAGFATDLAEIFGANDANATALAARIGGRSGEINARFGDLARQAQATGFTFNELTFSVRVDAATVSFQESGQHFGQGASQGGGTATSIRLEQLSLSLEVSRGTGTGVDPSRAAIAQDPFDLDPGSFRFVPPPEQTASEVAEQLRRVFGESNVGLDASESRAEILIGQTVFTASAANSTETKSGREGRSVQDGSRSPEASLGGASPSGSPSGPPRSSGSSPDRPIAPAQRIDLTA